MNGGHYNGKIIIASLALLCFVVLFIFGLHLYAKWFWRRSTRRQQVLWRRRHALHVQGQEPIITVGLDKAIVDSLPTFFYKAPVISLKEGVLECAVCLSEFQENDKGRLLPKCNHSFHTECIDMWFLSHTTCPLCRTSADCAEIQPSQNMDVNTEELGLSVSMQLEASTANGDANTHGGLERSATEGANQEALPSPGWRWRRSTSDRFSQNPSTGVQFPTNVLFWGNDSHVSSHTSTPQAPAPCLEHGQRGGRSLPHMAIDIHRSMHSLLAARSASSGAAQGYPLSHNEQTLQPQGKAATGTGLNVFKRLLSRERKIFPSEQEMGICGHGIGTSSGGMSSGS
ncbi:hypothetical protein L7F22_026891 [Adiantum nelumboides]|nr:hypothetical protein [Adiantum nelumboides]